MSAAYTAHLGVIQTFWNTCVPKLIPFQIYWLVLWACKKITQGDCFALRKGSGSKIPSLEKKTPCHWPDCWAESSCKSDIESQDSLNLLVMLDFNSPWDSFRMHVCLMDVLFNLCDGTVTKEQERSLIRRYMGSIYLSQIQIQSLSEWVLFLIIIILFPCTFFLISWFYLGLKVEIEVSTFLF